MQFSLFEVCMIITFTDKLASKQERVISSIPFLNELSLSLNRINVDQVSSKHTAGIRC